MQLVGRVAGNGFNTVGNYNLLVEGSINGRIGPRAGVYLLLVNPFVTIGRLAEGDGARGVPVNVEHGVVACARAILQTKSGGAVNGRKAERASINRIDSFKHRSQACVIPRNLLRAKTA